MKLSYTRCVDALLTSLRRALLPREVKALVEDDGARNAHKVIEKIEDYIPDNGDAWQQYFGEEITIHKNRQSSSEHPKSFLCYITIQEAKYLRSLGLGYSLDLEDGEFHQHCGKHGVPSFQGGDGGDSSGGGGRGGGGNTGGGGDGGLGAAGLGGYGGNSGQLGGDFGGFGSDGNAMGGGLSNFGGVDQTLTHTTPAEDDSFDLGIETSFGDPNDKDSSFSISVTSIGTGVLGLNQTKTYGYLGAPTISAGFMANAIGTLLGLQPTTTMTVDKAVDVVGFAVTVAMAPVGILGTLSKLSTAVDIAAKYGYAPKELAFALNTVTAAVSIVSRLNQISQLNAYANSVKSSMPSVAASISSYANIATGLLAVDAAMFGYNTYMGAQKFGGLSSTDTALGFNSDSERGGDGYKDAIVIGNLEKAISKATLERELWFDVYTSLDNLGRILAGGDLYNAGAGSVFYSVSDAFAPFQYMTGIMNPFANKEMDMAINSERYYDGMAGTDTYMTNLLKGNTNG